uniref:Uncharacterized protein n=1 Tax=Anguilla anguilla TaxID=7936 RepID=A0A0E9QKD2_ANGAN
MIFRLTISCYILYSMVFTASCQRKHLS